MPTYEFLFKHLVISPIFRGILFDILHLMPGIKLLKQAYGRDIL